eukprot:CAMPEP_0184697242 /NCGR_PEP_ID=MMETSP0313-20130426/4261_1 /TAXON_ID=2792 /ORGANISM="Porphyridium aerugineum, Strain SAG 1380-2" /LENGTH=146 /DNA_ID=CAMNT_0027156007 /DNA_START=359 /DNA_END=799 /DNA_ORIENTATION=+
MVTEVCSSLLVELAFLFSKIDDSMNRPPLFTWYTASKNDNAIQSLGYAKCMSTPRTKPIGMAEYTIISQTMSNKPPRSDWVPCDRATTPSNPSNTRFSTQSPRMTNLFCLLAATTQHAIPANSDKQVICIGDSGVCLAIGLSHTSL